MVVECLSCPDFAQCRGGVAPVTRAGYWRVPWRDEALPSAVPEGAGANTGDTQPQEKVLANRLQCLEPSACVGAALILERRAVCAARSSCCWCIRSRAISAIPARVPAANMGK